ncbi:terminase, partial [Klebsiella pneumoniae]|nr:terminase [Klebsiella pneumoniae]
MGRPSKYKPEFAEQAKKLAVLGATDAQMADFFEVSVSTINLW